MNKYAIAIILGVLSLGLIFQALAFQALEQAPFVFEYNLQGPATLESEIIKASGTIKEISVAYEFVGQVLLEISANGGRAYSKIINAKPLTDGFIPGNELRFKASIGQDSSLKKVVIGYTDSSGVSRLYRNPDLANYKNHKIINISGGSQEVFNYPLKVELDYPAPLLYFTAADSQTPLYYYLESEIAASPAAPRNDTPGVIASPEGAKQSRTFWVKVPQIPKEGVAIYMYYNKEIAALSAALRNNGVIASPEGAKQSKYNDGSKVFPFFDDFNLATLNEEKWDVAPDLKKEYNIKDGCLQLKDGLIISRNFKIKQGIIEFKAKAEENAGIQAVVRAKPSAQAPFPYEQIVYSSNYPGAEHTIAINDIAKLNTSKPIQPVVFYIYKAVVSSTGIVFERYGEDYEKQAQIQFLDVGNLNQGYIGLKANAAPFNAGSVYFDWIRARPYIEIEPKALKN